MPEVRVGPLLRHVGKTDATVWVETDKACVVEVLGSHADTFEVEGHHFAIVCVTDLDPESEHPYEVHLDGEKAWPPKGYEYPQPRIRLMPRDGSLRLLFGSCRASAPHHPPYTYQHWWHPKGKGIDVLRTYGMRMLRQPSALWPDALLMMGDQLYADQVNDTIKDLVADREVHANGPVEVLEDFEEYCIGYWDAWCDPVVRWMLSTIPTSMMFDDHEINDKWNTSQAWLDEKRQTDWYQTRIIGGLMAYWIYQHLGNMSPDELAKDQTFQRVTETRQGSEPIRELAEIAEKDDGTSHFSMCRDLGAARLIVADARTGRQLKPGQRRITTDEEWDWITANADGNYQHLLFASSLPILLPYGMHHIEAWSEAVGDGAWGRWLTGLGEKVRITANLDHWACFQESFRRFEDLLIDVASGRRGPAPDSVVLFGGDVHHCWVSEVEVPDEATKLGTKVWQVVCSGLRKEPSAVERVVLRLGHTGFVEAVGKALVKTTKVPKARLRWRPVSEPHFRNQVGTLEIAGGEMGVRIEKVTGGWRKPHLTTVIEHKLL
ncbi:alkaline phosphatase D family protein [Mycolicibacterium novocastrense]|uniref:Alkaline phosphatase D family protein n=1 Tax=Mycolicibacterium novocastrense TaxID=59813 RepID=A0AAW5SN28_MYCNV|nr:alkaline phosphatase D family protein [Mycolicibacterium novocastrense]MCV7025346.1 alkaline phosphatase D family protein [Mycolicibacterium novocastrense]GAT08997.1 Glr3825 protein [Mycolicibacterium novocastrense]